METLSRLVKPASKELVPAALNGPGEQLSAGTIVVEPNIDASTMDTDIALEVWAFAYDVRVMDIDERITVLKGAFEQVFHGLSFSVKFVKTIIVDYSSMADTRLNNDFESAIERVRKVLTSSSYYCC